MIDPPLYLNSLVDDQIPVPLVMEVIKQSGSGLPTGIILFGSPQGHEERQIWRENILRNISTWPFWKMNKGVKN